MSLRRPRIKAVAKIPQRRKPIESKEDLPEHNSIKNESLDHICPDSGGTETNSASTLIKSETLLKCESPNQELNPCLTEIDESPEGGSIGKGTDDSINAEAMNIQTKILGDYLEEDRLLFSHDLSEKDTSENVAELKETSGTTIADVVETNCSESLSKRDSESESNCDLSSVAENTFVQYTNTNIEKCVEQYATLGEVQILNVFDKPAIVHTIKESYLKKLVAEPQSVGNADKHPPPPPSPSKFNRSRIKAIPKFGQRKTSCSASESEDENKRISNRIRNDSVSSTAGSNYDIVSEAMFPIPPQKKVVRRERFRKITEARREFLKNYGPNEVPAKQSLKMIDLIYYNPWKNPMSKIKKEPEIEGNTEKVSVEEIVDDPSNEVIDEETNENVEEENDMPVPQIKIGPTGEIILDEKSLYIENKKVQKEKERIEKSALVNGDFAMGYGVYKKFKRAKDWTKQETLRLYKAINVIGTDFTLMTALFPKRNRRELKLKFKKEEKSNPFLIDKALMEPCKFNFTDLKKEVELEEKEMNAIEKIKEEEDKKLMRKKSELREAKKIKREERARKREELKEEHKQAVKKRLEDSLDQKELNHQNVKRMKLGKTSKPLRKTIQETDSDTSDEVNEFNDIDDSVDFLKQTRSGRVPKISRRLEYVDVNTMLEPPRKQRTKSLHSIPHENLIPGSVLVIPETDESQQVIYKMYMVTPEKTLTPLNIASDIVSGVVKSRNNESSEKIDKLVEEKNITIPAKETEKLTHKVTMEQDSSDFNKKEGSSEHQKPSTTKVEISEVVEINESDVCEPDSEFDGADSELENPEKVMKYPIQNNNKSSSTKETAKSPDEKIMEQIDTPTGLQSNATENETGFITSAETNTVEGSSENQLNKIDTNEKNVLWKISVVQTVE